MGINKDRHARIIIMRPETILHSEAGYIFADCSRPTRFFLQFGGGPYILRQLPSGVTVRQTCCPVPAPKMQEHRETAPHTHTKQQAAKQDSGKL